MNKATSTLSLSLSLSLSVALALASLISLTTSNPTHAESSSANASVTVANTIRLTLSGGDLVINNLAPGSSADSNIITTTVTSNSPYGFHLSATTGTSTGTDSLVNTADNTFTFANLTTNKASLSNFSDNTWGYSYSTDNGTNWISGDYSSATSGYNGLPLDNNDSGATSTTLFNSDSYLGSKSVQFKIGARSSTTQAAGTYSNTINFYAVTNPKPVKTIATATTMQEVNPGADGCPSTIPTDQTYQLSDSRDGTTYNVARLADGNCWMLDNLALDLTNASVQINLTADTTNATNTTLGYLKNGGGSSPYAVNAVRAKTKSGTGTWSDSYTDPYIITGYENDIPSDSTSTAGGYRIGTYYNYCAASAGSYCYDSSSSTGDATEDICPKGWRMPIGGSNGEYQALFSNASYNTYVNYRAALHLPLSGSFSNGSGSQNQGSRGLFWSSTRSNGSLMMYNLGLDDDFVGPSGISSRFYGFSVRCILGS